MRRNQFDGGWQSLITVLRQEHGAIFVATQILAQVEFSINDLAFPLFPGLGHLGPRRFAHVKWAHYIGVSARGLADSLSRERPSPGWRGEDAHHLNRERRPVRRLPRSAIS